jgi:hypothetical protein
MSSFQDFITVYRKQLQQGDVKTAYQGLMKYIDALQLHLKQKNPNYYITEPHYGCMDYSYFYYFPKSLKQHGLKIMVLFDHGAFEFQILLAGYNKSVQGKYLDLFKTHGFDKYHLAATTKGVDYIASYVLVAAPDFGDLDALTEQIQAGTLGFINDIEAFMNELKS